MSDEQDYEAHSKALLDAVTRGAEYLRGLVAESAPGCLPSCDSCGGPTVQVEQNIICANWVECDWQLISNSALRR